MRLLVAGAQLYVTRHAVERYIERVKPHLEYDEAAAELRRLLPMATLERWLPWKEARDVDSFAVLTDGIAFPVLSGRVVSCVTRSEVGAEIRVVRQQERRKDRDGGPKRKKQHGKVARDERRRARDAKGEAA